MKQQLQFTWLLIACTLLVVPACYGQLAEGQAKFLGNIAANSVPSNFGQYWNQITPENGGKWGEVEQSRDSYNWTAQDNSYSYAQQQNIPFKGHTLVWGSQEPGWISSLSQAEQRAEVEEWIIDYATRYPDTDMIDVVNEPLHAPASFRNALGGSGSTGWDWVVWSFEKARQYLPNAKLLLNDYGIINDGNAIQDYLEIITILNDRGLIDGIGIQCHTFNVDNLSANAIQNNLNTLASVGLPIYVSELDMRGSESQQRDRYAEKFPIFWEHPAVVGVTLWGYIEGQTWYDGTGLLRADGSEKPSMTWLKSYFDDAPDTGGGDQGTGNIVVRARGVVGDEQIRILVDGVEQDSFTLGTSYANYSVSGQGTIQVEFTNDQGDRDVQVDYITVDGTTYQAEDQAVNTGVYQDGSCGGSYSDTLHCGGYIEFDTGGGAACEPNTITHYVSINDGSWDGTSTVTVVAGDKVELGPQPQEGGSWSWTGPNGFTQTGRVVTLSTTATSDSGTYTATYTNDCGTNSSSAIELVVNAGGNSGNTGNVVVRARGIDGGETISIAINGNEVDTFTLGTNYEDYTVSGNGTVRVEFTNDGGDRDVQVDYIVVDGTTYEAEDQELNTGVYQDGSCGGSYSEMMHCSGYIDFNLTGDVDNPGDDSDPEEPEGCDGIAMWSASAIYDTTGTQVVLHGIIYQNRWYSSNQNPETNSGPWQVWEVIGNCSESAMLSTDNYTQAALASIQVYPNPSRDGRFTLTGIEDQTEIRIYDIQGRMVYQANTASQKQLDISLTVGQGVYLAHIKTANTEHIKKLIVH